MRPILILLAFAAALGTAQADPFLVVPGRSIGQTHLGRNGDFSLKKLPPPTREDSSLGGNHYSAWLAKTGTDTLYIHTWSNGYLNPPRPGVTVLEIRITSRQFHTQNGIAPGATLAQIRQHFPQGRVTGERGYFYMANRQGIAFEFAHRPTLTERCIAVTVYPPGRADDLAPAAQVRDILHSHP